MNSKLRALLATVVVTLACMVVVGCTSGQLIKQADLNDRAAQVAEDSASDLQSILSRYPAGSIEDGQLLDIIRAVIPDSQQAKLDNLIATGRTVRESAEILAGELPKLALTLREQADDLRADAAADQSNLDNTVDAITSAAQSIGGVFGVVGLIAGAWYRKQRNEATDVTQDIVSSIQASPTVRAAIDSTGGAELRASMKTETQQVVKKIKDTI